MSSIAAAWPEATLASVQASGLRRALMAPVSGACAMRLDILAMTPTNQTTPNLLIQTLPSTPTMSRDGPKFARQVRHALGPLPQDANGRGAPSMTIKTRIAVANSLFVLGTLSFLILAVYVHSLFVVPFFGVVVAAGTWSLRLRCPRCGRPVFKKEVRALDVRWTYWGGFAPAKCAGCGLNFARASETHPEKPAPQRETKKHEHDTIEFTAMPARKRVLGALALLAMNIVGGLGWTILVDHRFLYPTIAFVVICLWLLFSTRCPRCRKSVHRQVSEASSVTPYCLLPSVCARCGFDFRRQALEPSGTKI